MITVKDVSERYGCTLATARKYLRQMYHFEKPLTAPLWAFNEWEQSRGQMPDETDPARTKRIRTRVTNGRVIVPRKRG